MLLDLLDVAFDMLELPDLLGSIFAAILGIQDSGVPGRSDHLLSIFKDLDRPHHAEVARDIEPKKKP